MGRVPTVIVDTNLANGYGRIEAMNKIEAWHAEGRVDVFNASRVWRETSGNVWRRMKGIGRKYLVEPGVVGPTSIVGDMVVASRHTPDFEELRAMLFPSVSMEKLLDNPNQTNDTMILLTAIEHRIGFLLTEDGNFHRCAAVALERYNVRIMRAAAFAALLEREAQDG